MAKIRLFLVAFVLMVSTSSLGGCASRYFGTFETDLRVPDSAEDVDEALKRGAIFGLLAAEEYNRRNLWGQKPGQYSPRRPPGGDYRQHRRHRYRY